MSRISQIKALRLSRRDVYQWIALIAILAIAAVLRFSNLEALGYANHYYTAAIKSMLQSWHNFFFVATEPGGSVSVDKPPVGLWLQAISAYFFGVNGFGVLLPQIVAGILSVLVVYYLVRRSFGTVAGLLAALVLAITPIVVATDRNNTIDSTLILTLLLAAWAFIKATESSRLRYLLLGALLVGIGFNIKMLEAFLPLPAFYALYFLGSKDRLLRKLGKMALATLLLVAVSLSWMVAVDLTPADQRPYVGSSGDNSEMSLMIGYNGINRLVGMFRGNSNNIFGSVIANLGGNGNPSNGRPDDNFSQQNTDGGPRNGNVPPQNTTDGGRQQFGPGGDGGVGAGGMSGTGQPGALRLFTTPLSKEVSWLLPFGLFSAVLLAFRQRLHWPIAPKHQALVLWGGWLVTAGIFFSIAGFFHEYYLSTLAAPLAALVAIGALELWSICMKRPWLAITLLLVAAGGTLWLQYRTATAFMKTIRWMPLVEGLFIGGAVLLIAVVVMKIFRIKWHSSQIIITGFTCILAAMLITPGVWSALTMLNSSQNQSLPSAYSGYSQGVANGGGLQVNQALLNYLMENTQGARYLMAVPSSMQGADYVLVTGRPVLYLGGFMGQDQVLTSDQLAQLVANGELKYIYWGGEGGGLSGQSDISTWVTNQCIAVTGYDTTTVNAGAPDGTVAGTNGAGSASAGRGGMQVSLYNCGK